jgi:ABC-type branched-subunit amino acid transport system ATPase component
LSSLSCGKMKKQLQLIVLLGLAPTLANALIGHNTIAKTTAQKAMSESNKESVGQMLGGLVFLKTSNRSSLVEFYMNRIGMATWLEQPNITILSHGNMILGFHQLTGDEQPDLHGMYTFVYPSIEQVDEMYNKFQDIADDKPRYNDRYKIYQFFAKDPEGRNLEFQAFLHPLTDVSSRLS